MKKIFTNNYYMAIISIVIIVLIVALSLNVNSNNNDSTGQAYLPQTVIEPESPNAPAMIKTYTETEPTAYAYLREN